jgi:acyl-CoA synthetase (AMP-forming)/AMP-acid ligase II
MPLCWVGGFVFCLLRALASGGCYLTQDVFEPGAALELLARERVTDVAAWPAVTKALMEHPDFPSTDLSSLRNGIWEAMPADRRPPDPGLISGSLGMSETAGPHTYKTRAEDLAGLPEDHRGAFGRPVDGMEHRIVDPDTGLDLPEGEVGELLVRGASLMLGLHRRERSDVFDADGWYHTGDRGCFHDGWFWFHGRQADLIKTGGSNVAPAEVEQCLMEADEVKLAFVLGVPDENKGERVVALVVPRAGEKVDGGELRDQLRSRLSSYKVPEHVFVIDDEQVPWLVSQKADRRALQTLAAELATRR